MNASRFSKSIEERKLALAESIKPFVPEFGRNVCNSFYAYWTELDSESQKMRFEAQKFWNTEHRLQRWLKTEKYDNKARSGSKQPVVVANPEAEAQRKAEMKAMNERLEQRDQESVPRWAMNTLIKSGFNAYKMHANQVADEIRRLYNAGKLDSEENLLAEKWLTHRNQSQCKMAGTAAGGT